MLWFLVNMCVDKNSKDCLIRKAVLGNVDCLADVIILNHNQESEPSPSCSTVLQSLQTLQSGHNHSNKLQL